MIEQITLTIGSALSMSLVETIVFVWLIVILILNFKNSNERLPARLW
jgi:hypothetical protein